MNTTQWRRFWSWLALFGMVLPLSTVGPTAAEPTVLQVATDEEKQGGGLVALSKAALARVGYEAHIVYLPWKRALSHSLAGEFDMLLGAYYTPGRADVLAYSNPIGTVDLCLAKLRDTPLTSTRLSDLRGYRIGYIRGGTVSPEFDLAAKTYLQVEYVAFYEYNIRKLLAGRIDVLIDKRTMLQATIASKYPEAIDRIEILDPPLQTFSFYNAFPKSRPGYQEHLEAFNQGLAAIESDGTLADIQHQYSLRGLPGLGQGDEHAASEATTR